ncbi:MAG TPA: hypothetical protein VJB98_02455 [Candidatus Paceibacterota bacterium]
MTGPALAIVIVLSAFGAVTCIVGSFHILLLLGKKLDIMIQRGRYIRKIKAKIKAHRAQDQQ